MRILTLLATLSITACGDEQNGPASLGEPFTTSTAKVANPGDNEVEFITWYLPSEGRTTEITFILLVPDCDAIGSCRRFFRLKQNHLPRKEGVALHLRLQWARDRKSLHVWGVLLQSEEFKEEWKWDGVFIQSSPRR